VNAGQIRDIDWPGRIRYIFLKWQHNSDIGNTFRAVSFPRGYCQYALRDTPGGVNLKSTLQAGLTFEYQYKVPENKTVPQLFPEFPEGNEMPVVFATGFMVGLFEFVCIKALQEHLDWPGEMTVGTHIDVSHLAATPPGMIVTVTVRLTEVEGRKLVFRIEAFDEADKISEGTHRRFVINRDKFNAGVEKKAAAAGSGT
jgi:fluoroacetyl-CoA thioesterase